ncbi:hypothetical protein P0W64_04055 [Tsukamurella sp. 8F]|uniref:hypothetical protein n=1 Tax=unclassified Tsukamurella TaxID=2633480 RepID=UPI0023B8FB48|nr:MULTISPECIES: hypothetical protein [unclassified Tsukamurella]MDF0529660.1 hypothetical protein [Tsukamurella sp. 8J]MDF0585945.1 hypothetical protein [Tsukamurella sp. 8F]
MRLSKKVVGVLAPFVLAGAIGSVAAPAASARPQDDTWTKVDQYNQGNEIVKVYRNDRTGEVRGTATKVVVPATPKKPTPEPPKGTTGGGAGSSAGSRSGGGVIIIIGGGSTGGGGGKVSVGPVVPVKTQKK